MSQKKADEWPPQAKYPKADNSSENIELIHEGGELGAGLTFNQPEATLTTPDGGIGEYEIQLAHKSGEPFVLKGDLVEREAVLARLHQSSQPLSSVQTQGHVENVRVSPENPSSRLGVTFENITATPEINPEGAGLATEREPGPSKDAIAPTKKDEKVSHGSAGHTNVSHHKGGEERKKTPWAGLAVAGASLLILFFVRIWQIGSSLFEAVRDAARQGDAPAKQAKKESGGGHAH